VRDSWTGDQWAEVESHEKIAEDVREGNEKAQKEFLRRKQLRRDRQGRSAEGEPDGFAQYRGPSRGRDSPEKVREAALREVGKMETVQ